MPFLSAYPRCTRRVSPESTRASWNACLRLRGVCVSVPCGCSSLPPWVYQESLPREYARIFSFDSVRRTQRAALARAEAVDRGELPGSVRQPGTFLRVLLKNVPRPEAGNRTAWH